MGPYGTFLNRPLYGGALLREFYIVVIENMFYAYYNTRDTPTHATNLTVDFLLR